MKLRKTIFRSAARLLVGNETDFSCFAISLAATGTRDERPPEREFYERVFKLRDRGFWSADGDCCFVRTSDDEVFTARQIALELAALLVEDGFTLEDFSESTA